MENVMAHRILGVGVEGLKEQKVNGASLPGMTPSNHTTGLLALPESGGRGRGDCRHSCGSAPCTQRRDASGIVPLPM